jgi:hypothetical protein
MTANARPVIGTGLLLVASLLLARPARAQAILFEPFAGIASGPAATVGVSVWRLGTETIGWRGSFDWLGPTDAQNAGGSVRGGVVAAAPIAGGPPVRPFVALDVGVAKRSDDDVYPYIRPAVGVILRPGAALGYVVEGGRSINRDRPDEWSALVGLVVAW